MHIGNAETKASNADWIEQNSKTLMLFIFSVLSSHGLTVSLLPLFLPWNIAFPLFPMLHPHSCSCSAPQAV